MENFGKKMKGEYLVTFHTHYDSLVCFRSLKEHALTQSGVLAVKLIPVPRSVSSSCGTALRLNFEDKTSFDIGLVGGFEYESVFEADAENSYTKL